jgi:hypothetical protein
MNNVTHEIYLTPDFSEDICCETNVDIFEAVATSLREEFKVSLNI